MLDDNEVTAEAFDLLTAYGMLRHADGALDTRVDLARALADRWANLHTRMDAHDLLGLALALAEVSWQMAEVGAKLQWNDVSLAGALIASSRAGFERNAGLL